MTAQSTSSAQVWAHLWTCQAKNHTLWGHETLNLKALECDKASTEPTGNQKPKESAANIVSDNHGFIDMFGLGSFGRGKGEKRAFCFCINDPHAATRALSYAGGPRIRNTELHESATDADRYETSPKKRQLRNGDISDKNLARKNALPRRLRPQPC